MNRYASSQLEPAPDTADQAPTTPPSTPWTSGDTRMVLVVSAIALVLRVTGLAKFPMMEADEGLWTWSTKNHVLFGDWFLDGHTHVFLSPIFHALTTPLFRVFGPGIAVARLISGVAGALSVAMIYLLVWRLARRRQLALWTSLILACTQWSIIMSRKALIESLELFLMLSCAALVTYESTTALVAAGVVLGLVALTKINGLFLAIPLALLVFAQAEPNGKLRFQSSRAWTSCLIFGATALAVTAIGYGVLFSMHPTEFRNAFLFELNGVHFEANSHPIFRLGRFGLDPAQAGRTLIALFREEPFLLVLASIGVALAPYSWVRGREFFAMWLAVGLPYFLCQMFQPLRYFFLLIPALAFFAALFLDDFSLLSAPSTGRRTRVSWIPLGVFLLFDLSYAAMNAIGNRNTHFDDIRQWVAANTQTSDPMLASAMLATDLPRRVYTYYRLVNPANTIDAVVRRLGIHYIIVDDSEWPTAYRAEVASNYARVFAGAHSSVYEVRPAP